MLLPCKTYKTILTIFLVYVTLIKEVMQLDSDSYMCDNKSTLVQLEKYIDNGFRQYTTDISISSFDNGQLLLTANNREKFDVLFLDIDMPKITGFDIAKSLRKSFSNCFLIFISSHSDLVYKSFVFSHLTL